MAREGMMKMTTRFSIDDRRARVTDDNSRYRTGSIPPG
jgi:hypothetical protein